MDSGGALWRCRRLTVIWRRHCLGTRGPHNSAGICTLEVGLCSIIMETVGMTCINLDGDC